VAGEAVAGDPGAVRALRHRVVCKGARIPRGWVVVAQCSNPACDGDGANAWVVKRPGATEVIWIGCTVPEGWTVVRTTRSEALPGVGDNAVTIARDRS
jgi:uncharacterized protein YbdZ (MbtH family)